MFAFLLLITSCCLDEPPAIPPGIPPVFEKRRAWEIVSPEYDVVYEGYTVSIEAYVRKPEGKTGTLRVSVHTGSTDYQTEYRLGTRRTEIVSIDNGGSRMPEGQYVLDLFDDERPGQLLERVVVWVKDGPPESLPTVDNPPMGTTIVSYDGVIRTSGKAASKSWFYVAQNGTNRWFFTIDAEPTGNLLWRYELSLPIETADYEIFAFPADPSQWEIAPTDMTAFKVIVPDDAGAPLPGPGGDGGTPIGTTDGR